ncbi:hypothetical protein E8E14_006328 [Neopestalotiopsis sp. 37M]|nr:hypothetical protein E8E14_006328 [Neopestalotiopsis sp. 37M]
MPKTSESQSSSERVQSNTSPSSNDTIYGNEERSSVARTWHYKPLLACPAVGGDSSGSSGGMMQRWIQEAPAAQPYHTIAEVIVAPRTSHREQKDDRMEVDSQVAMAGSQASAE